MTERRDGIIGKPYRRRISSSNVAKNKEFKLAIQEHRFQDVKTLLEELNVDPNQKLHGITALNMAVYSNSVDIVRLLLDHNANVNEYSLCADSEEGEHEFPVVTAARLCRSRPRQSEIIRLLISHGADINKTDYGHLSPLYYAVHNQNSTVVNLLIQAGANVNLPLGPDGKTALFEAVARNNLSILEMLVQNHAKIDVTNCHGESPLHVVTDEGLKLAEYLIGNGVQINSASDRRVTPLHSALQRRQFRVAHLLLVHGADPNLFSPKPGEVSSLALAIESGHFELAALLVEVGCNLLKEYKQSSDFSLQKINENEDFVRYISHRAMNSLSLKATCRIFLRTYFSRVSDGRSVLKDFKELPLPGILLDYLCLHFEESALYT